MIPKQLEARIWRRIPATRSTAGVVDEEETLRILDGKGLQHHRIDEAEDCSVGADAKTEREERHGGERWRSPEQAEGVDDVAAELVEQAKSK